MISILDNYQRALAIYILKVTGSLWSHFAMGLSLKCSMTHYFLQE